MASSPKKNLRRRAAAQQLAREIQERVSSNARLRPAVITANNLTATPPTVTIQLAGETTDIPGIRFLHGGRTAVGTQVWVWQDGPDIFVLGSLA